MKVVAKKGERCPREGNPRSYITDSTVVEVADTSYYRRLVREGSLLPAPPEKKAVTAAKGDK